MNFRRGFFRLWLIVSLLWALLVFAFGSLSVAKVPVWQILPAISEGWASKRELPSAQMAATREAEYEAVYKGGDQARIDSFLKSLNTDEKQRMQELALVNARIRRGQVVMDGAITLGWIAALPPLCLLILGATVGWALSGFRRN